MCTKFCLENILKKREKKQTEKKKKEHNPGQPSPRPGGLLAEAHFLPGLLVSPPCASSSLRPSKPRPKPDSRRAPSPPFSSLTPGTHLSATGSFFLLESERDTTPPADFNPGICDFPCLLARTDPYLTPRDAPCLVFPKRAFFQALPPSSSVSDPAEVENKLPHAASFFPCSSTPTKHYSDSAVSSSSLWCISFAFWCT